MMIAKSLFSKSIPPISLIRGVKIIHVNNFSNPWGFSIIYFPYFLLLLFALKGSAQNSISKKDVGVTTQLTFIKVGEADKSTFETALSQLSLLAKAVELKEDYDWLIYESTEKEYLFINFSSGLDDVLKLSDYEEAFGKLGKKAEFDSIPASLKNCSLEVSKSFLQEMLLPWSTVEAISTSEHPLTKMVEYKVFPRNWDEFDYYTRRLVKLLKETEYPHPLEGNRGVFGAYSSLFHIWFYDTDMNENICNHIELVLSCSFTCEFRILHPNFAIFSFRS